MHRDVDEFIGKREELQGDGVELVLAMLAVHDARAERLEDRPMTIDVLEPASPVVVTVAAHGA
ncbi:MAG: hypothetical protein Q7T55_11820 [Solirubrobacteraceae bacterium]|nr:hypothetical protein [Solirubrobacteraceae bacterium]